MLCFSKAQQVNSYQKNVKTEITVCYREQFCHTKQDSNMPTVHFKYFEKIRIFSTIKIFPMLTHYYFLIRAKRQLENKGQPGTIWRREEKAAQTREMCNHCPVAKL